MTFGTPSQVWEGLLEFDTTEQIFPRGIDFLETFIPRLTDTIYLPEFAMTFVQML
jgi:hypothetical protein